MTHNMCEKRRVRVARAFGYLGHLAALGAGHRLEIPQVVGSVAAQCCSQPLAERAERQTRSCTPESCRQGPELGLPLLLLAPPPQPPQPPR